MVLLNFVVCLGALVVCRAHAFPADEANDYMSVLTDALNEQSAGQNIEANAMQYLKLAISQVTNILTMATDAETLHHQIELLKMTVDDIPIPHLKGANSLLPAKDLLPATLRIYADVLNGRMEDVESIVTKRVHIELDGILQGEEPESARKVKWVLSRYLVPAMKKLKAREDNANAVDDVLRSWYSTCVAAGTYLEGKDSFDLLGTALSARTVPFAIRPIKIS